MPILDRWYKLKSHHQEQHRKQSIASKRDEMMNEYEINAYRRLTSSGIITIWNCSVSCGIKLNMRLRTSENAKTIL